MARADQRRRLAGLRAELAGWRGTVSAQAATFHDRRARLLNEVDRELHRWWPWPGGTGFDEIAARAAALRGLVIGLRELFTRVTAVQRRVHQLRQQAASSGDDVMAARMVARCERWLAEVARQGTNVIKASELEEDRAAVSHIEAALRENEEGAKLLTEADDLLAHLTGPLRPQLLGDDLSRWKSTFLEAGPTPAFLAEIRSRLDEERRLTEPVHVQLPPPPPALAEVRGLLADARQWARSLDDRNTDRVQGLMDRLDQLESDPAVGDDEVEELVRDAGALAGGFRERARQDRDDRLSALALNIEIYTDVCHADAGLEQALDDLRAMTADSPPHHGDWIRAWENVQDRFAGLATARHVELLEYLHRRLEEMREAIEQLRVGPASSALTQRLLAVRSQIDVANQAATVEAVLSALSGCRAMAAEVAEIGKAVVGELDHLSRRRTGLVARLQALARVQREADVADVSSGGADLAGQLSHEQSAGMSLDLQREQLDEADRRVTALERELAAACLVRIESDRQFCLLTSALLIRIGGEPPLVVPDRPDDTASADALALLAPQLRALSERSAARLEGRAETLAGRATKTAGDLRALLAASGPLAPDSRETAQRLLNSLEEVPARDAEHALVRVQQLADAVADAETFLNTALGDKRQAREAADALREKLRAFTEAGLATYYPALADRVGALLQGIPWESEQWDVINCQLGIAGDMLARLEAHSLRLAAHQLAEACRDVRERASRSNDAGFRYETQQALDDLTSHAESYEPPPLRLRERIRQLAARRGPRGA